MIIKIEGISLHSGVKSRMQLDLNPVVNTWEYVMYMDLNKTAKRKRQKTVAERFEKNTGSKQHARNLTTTTNTTALALVCYGARILKWAEEELKGKKRKSKTLLTIHDAYYARKNNDYLYMTSTNGGTGWQIVKECVCIELERVRKYLAQSKQTILVLGRNY